MGVMLKKPPGTAGSAWPAIAIGCFVAFGGICLFSAFTRRLRRALTNIFQCMVTILAQSVAS